MALDSRAKAAVALNRFGFMPKAGAPSDPRAALLADLANPTAGQIANHELPSVGEAARATFAFRQVERAQVERVRVEPVQFELAPVQFEPAVPMMGLTAP